MSAVAENDAISADAASIPELFRKLSKQSRDKLTAPLRALLANPGLAHPLVDVRDGKVKVKLRLRKREDNRARLERKGLEVLQIGDRFALGWISIDDLITLVEMEEVEGIEPG